MTQIDPFDYLNPTLNKISLDDLPAGFRILPRAMEIFDDKKRSFEDIRLIAKKADQLISEYQARQIGSAPQETLRTSKRVVSSLVKIEVGASDGMDYEEIDGRRIVKNTDYATLFKDDDPYLLTDLDSLTGALIERRMTRIRTIAAVTNPEYHAAVALRSLAMAYFIAHYKVHKKTGKIVRASESYKVDLYNLQRVNLFLIHAMDSLGHSEKISLFEEIDLQHRSIIRNITKLIPKELNKAIPKIINQESNKIIEEEKLKRKRDLREWGKRAHKKSYEIKDFVLDDWLKIRARFSSAEKAADYYFQLLPKKFGVSREHRTIVKWILTHAKKIR